MPPTGAPPEMASVPARAADPVVERPAPAASTTAAGSGAPQGFEQTPHPGVAQAAEPTQNPQSQPERAQDVAAVEELPASDRGPARVPGQQSTAPASPTEVAQPAPTGANAAPPKVAQPPNAVVQVQPAAEAEESRRIGSGRAAWYQHAGRTASGEEFDPNQHTAAHHTLPFGTRVRVVNEQTGRSVTVRINDRIPRKAKILIDLSRASAKAIGMAGVDRVSLYQVDGADVAATARESERTTTTHQADVDDRRRQWSKRNGTARPRPSAKSARAVTMSRRLAKTQAEAFKGTSRRTSLAARRSREWDENPGDIRWRPSSPAEDVLGESSEAVLVSLPQSLAPTDWLASISQQRTFVDSVGWVRGDEDVLRTVKQPLRAVPRTSIRAVAACGEAISGAAQPHGPVRTEATAAGQERRRSGQRIVPVEVRLTYTGWFTSEARQARIGCELDGTGRVVRLTPP